MYTSSLFHLLYNCTSSLSFLYFTLALSLIRNFCLPLLRFLFPVSPTTLYSCVSFFIPVSPTTLYSCVSYTTHYTCLSFYCTVHIIPVSSTTTLYSCGSYYALCLSLLLLNCTIYYSCVFYYNLFLSLLLHFIPVLPTTHYACLSYF